LFSSQVLTSLQNLCRVAYQIYNNRNLTMNSVSSTTNDAKSPLLAKRSPKMGNLRVVVDPPQDMPFKTTYTMEIQNVQLSADKIQWTAENSLQNLQHSSKPSKISKGSNSARSHNEKSSLESRSHSGSSSGTPSAVTPTFIPARPASAASKTPETPSQKSHSGSGSNSANSSAPTTPKASTVAATYAADALRKIHGRYTSPMS